CLTYPETSQWLPHTATTVVTGNPVRPSIADLIRVPRDGAGNTLLVLGGSQGARAVNDMLLEFAARHAESLRGWRIVHQTGAQDEARVRAAYATSQFESRVAKFFDDPAQLYLDADLVVSRAGGTTLSELACAGLPAVL